MSFSREELVNYRIERAEEAYEDALLLIEKERWNSAANRLYYACFYIVSAYLALHNLKATTHAGLKATFNKELVKTGKIDRSEGVLFNKLFSLRQKADYEDFVEMQKADLSPMISTISELIEDVKEIIEEEE